jgi:integrase/recombinase XerD
MPGGRRVPAGQRGRLNDVIPQQVLHTRSPLQGGAGQSGSEDKNNEHDTRGDVLRNPVAYPVQATSCDRLRTPGEGCRAGEALGLRHEDIAAGEREISIVPRDNANGARAKSGGRAVPVGAELVRPYADYLHGEYGDTDSDYVFINIWAEPRGQAWSYPAAYDLVMRLRAKTGIAFDPHWFRHSAATRWLRDGVPIEVVSKLLGHSSVTVTSAVYGHLTAQDGRAALENAGWFAGQEVSW